MAAPVLQYVEPEQVAIAGVPSDSVTVRVAASRRALGRLCGLVIDPLNQHLRYFVVRASGLLGKTMLVPAVKLRLDPDRHAIEVDLDAAELRAVRNFTLSKALAYGVCERATSASY